MVEIPTKYDYQKYRSLTTPLETIGNKQNVSSTSPWSKVEWREAGGSEVVYGFRNPGPPYRSGGPMTLIRYKTHQPRSSPVKISTGAIPWYAYSGSFYAPLPAHIMPTEYNLDSLGTEAIGKTLPTSPAVSLSNFIYELKDVPGMLMQTRDLFSWMAKTGRSLTRNRNLTVADAVRALRSPKTLGGDYLNLQFGWMPVLGDLIKTYKLGQTIDKRVKFIREHNMGKPVRRTRRLRDLDRTTLLESTEYNGIITACILPVLASQLYHPSRPNGTRVRTLRERSRVWFTATYKYYSPELESMPDWVIKKGLYGLNLDPAVIYTAVPWTWMLDWFTSAGTTLRNVVEMSKYNTVIESAYVMCHQSTEHSYRCTNNLKNGVNGQSIPIVATSYALYEHKLRRAASPYGFGLSWEGFSPYQMSILAALGISKGH